MEESSPIPGTLLSKKINKILDIRIENDKETLDALRELSKFFVDNTPEKRRNLETEIEKRSLSINNNFLTALGTVKNSLDVVYNDVCAMNTAVNEMRDRLAVTKAKTHHLIDETSRLQLKTQNIGMKHEVTAAFLSKFQLSAEEMAAIRGGVVNQEMFSALDRLQHIHSSCKHLAQAGCQSIAEDIMEQMINYEDVVLDRLFRWTQGRCRMIESSDPSELLPKAMARLQDRPHLFRQLLSEYGTYRRDVLVRQFIDALTRGGRPIELRATEPKRYVDDMLAWLHQAVPVEKENLNLLLKECEKTDVEETIQQVLSNITEAVCHPLKVRIEHILHGEENVLDPLMLHGILCLIKYYRDVIVQMIGGSQLDNTLSDLAEIAEKNFLLCLQGKVSTFLNKIEPPPMDLSPAPASNKVLALLGQLLTSESTTDRQQSQTSQMVACVVDPLIMYITECASRLPATEMSVYLLNCFHFIQTSLALHPFLDERLERLKAQCDAQMDTLTSEQASALVAHLGLGNIYTILESHPQAPVSAIPGMDSSSISAVAVKLEKLLTSPDLYHLPQLSLLSSNNHRVLIQKRASYVICSIYRNLHEAVHNPENLYPNPQDLLRLTPEYLLQTLTT